MKSSSIVFLIIIFSTFNSCEKVQFKESSQNISLQVIEPAQDISGQWLWLSSWFDEPISYSNPKTPQNTGIQELIMFNSNKTWIKIQNNIRIDSGIYSTGHGSYLPYIGAYKFMYDSIVYIRNGVSINGTQDYYKIYNDTLQFCGGFAGYAGSGSKFYIKK